MSLMLQDSRLPAIVADFLREADNLRKIIQKATLEIVEDIKAMLYDRESKFVIFFGVNLYMLTRS